MNNSSTFMNPQSRPKASAGDHFLIHRGKCFLPLVLAVLSPLLSGCSSTTSQQTSLVFKPNMLFTDAGPFVYQTMLPLQTESGSMFSGGARTVGCAACK